MVQRLLIMKIALLSLYLPGGSKIGVGYQVHALANALSLRGHEVTVFSQCPPGQDARYTCIQVQARKRLSTFGFAWDLRKYDLTPYDVLNAHGDDWFLWGKKRPRHIHTYHGSCFAEMLHAQSFSVRLRMAALAACEYNSLLLPDDTVTVSENTRRYIPGIRHVIPCGVNTAAFKPAPEKRHDKPAILFVGTVHGRKRGAMLLDLFRKKIRPAIPQAEIWCVCGRPDNEPEGDGVIFTGRVSEEQLTDLFQRAWCFCLPSSYEGFGVPYIEAMASGLPVVASPNVGAREVTRNGQDGLIPQDNQLAQTLINLLSDSSARERLIHAGLTRSRDFSWDRVCGQYEDVYRGASGKTEAKSA